MNTITRGSPAMPEKLPQKQDVVVFDCDMFRQAFDKWVRDKGPKPGVRILFSFGDTWDYVNGFEKCELSATIAGARLLFRMKQVRHLFNNPAFSTPEQAFSRYLVWRETPLKQQNSGYHLELGRSAWD
jgi:hypothetical protein